MTVITIMLLIVGIVKASEFHKDSIFMSGRIIHDVQTSAVYQWSKIFVDMSLKYDRETVIDAYRKIRNRYCTRPPDNKIAEFLDDYFNKPGAEFEKCNPTDWKKYPKLIHSIRNGTYKRMAIDLNDRWRTLCRKVKNDVKVNSDRYSMIYVPNPGIVLMDDYREFYYYDSFWIIVGLIHSEMFTTVKGMLENFLHMVNIYGFVPLGNRVYYTDRSNAPLLTTMVKIYYEATKDKNFVKKYIHLLEKEYEFWINNRLVTLTVNKNLVDVARYYVLSKGPRPDSYKADFGLTKFLNEKQTVEFYRNMKSVSESRWEYSSRWIRSHGNYDEGAKKVFDIETPKIIPVDLNAILCGNAKILSDFFQILGLKKKASYYKKIHKGYVDTVKAVMWDDKEGIWFDYDMESKKPMKYFYASNVTPLWTSCYNKSDEKKIARKVVKYLTKKVNVTRFIGGIPASYVNKGNTWDYPHSIPPLVHIIIRGLASTNLNDAKKLAQKLAKILIESIYKGYKGNRETYGSYDCYTPGKQGEEIGESFKEDCVAWTNAVLLDLLHLYGRKNPSEGINSGEIISASVLLTKLHFLLLLILCNYQMFY